MFTIYTLLDKVTWKKIVDTFQDNDIYYYPEYLEILKQNGDGEPILIHYIYQDVQAINVVIKRDISYIEKFQNIIEKNKYFDFTTPYGYGGFLFKKRYSIEKRKTFIKNYIEFCKLNNIVSEFIRFHPISRNALLVNGLIDVQDVGPTVTVFPENLEEAWKNFSSKNRNVIRKSIKNGTAINWGLSSSLMSKFKSLYYDTMTRDNASNYYFFSEPFFESIMTELRYNALFFYASHKEHIIAIAMILFHNNKAHYHLSATDYNYRHLSASNHLLSEIINYCSYNGYTSLHLGGGLGAKIDGLYSFKKAFNRKNDTTFSIGRIIFDKVIYEDLTRNMEHDFFFPLYRR